MTSVIPGMKTPDQARGNAAAADVALTADELELIRGVPEAATVPLGASGKPIDKSPT